MQQRPLDGDVQCSQFLQTCMLSKCEHHCSTFTTCDEVLTHFHGSRQALASSTRDQCPQRFINGFCTAQHRLLTMDRSMVEQALVAFAAGRNHHAHCEQHKSTPKGESKVHSVTDGDVQERQYRLSFCHQSCLSMKSGSDFVAVGAHLRDVQALLTDASRHQRVKGAGPEVSQNLLLLRLLHAGHA